MDIIGLMLHGLALATLHCFTYPPARHDPFVIRFDGLAFD
jgi:hypothetical protein